MTVETVEFESKALGGTGRMNVLVPDTDKARYPTVYMQHGVGDTHETFFAETELAEYARQVELIIVTPDGAEGWYCNDPRDGGAAWEDHIAREVVNHVDTDFPTIASPAGRALAGFSMGGYGAMMLALKHPYRFAAACAHAGSFAFGHALRPDRPQRSAFMQAVAPPGGRYDLFTITEALAALGGVDVAIRFAVGTSDHLLDVNRQFHAHLEALGMAHEYAEVDGGHQWSTVNRELPAMLAFLARHLAAAG